MALKQTKLYELVFLVRQDVSSSDIDNITNELIKIITDNEGEIIKNEYWGQRNLAYIIGNNKKAHYKFLGIEGNNSTLKAIREYIKMNEDIIRDMITNVEKISPEPSPILKNRNVGNEENTEKTVDVTANRNTAI